MSKKQNNKKHLIKLSFTKNGEEPEQSADLLASMRRIIGPGWNMNIFDHGLYLVRWLRGECTDGESDAKINQHSQKTDPLGCNAKQILIWRAPQISVHVI